MKGNKESPVSEPSMNEEQVKEDMAGGRAGFEGVLDLLPGSVQIVSTLTLHFSSKLQARNRKGKLTRRMQEQGENCLN